MKLTLTTCAFLLLPLFSLCQSQLDKKLKKALPFEVVPLMATDNYSFTPNADLIYHPSQTFKGDTTGVSNDGEYLMFRDDIATKEGELFKLFRLPWVTNWEYEEFVQWVKDSTTLEAVYLNSDPTGNHTIADELIAEMLDYGSSTIDPSQPLKNRELFNFSWRMKGITDQQIIPLISDFYLPQYERLNKVKEWDERKIWYNDPLSGKLILISPDRSSWAHESNQPFDLYYNFANHYSTSKESAYYPAIGLLGTQIQAYLHFKQQKIQKELDAKGFNYLIHLSLPTPEEVALADTSDCDCRMSFTTEANDMTEHWKITNQKYNEFVLWVQDSLLREFIYTSSSDIPAELLSDLLDYQFTYYEEVNLSWNQFRAGEIELNRYLFPFDYKFDWKKKLPAVLYLPLIQLFFNDIDHFTDEKGNIDQTEFMPQFCFYQYYWEDLSRKAQEGELIWDEKSQTYETKDYWIGKDLVTDADLPVNQKNGVRKHANLSQYIIDEKINIYPGIVYQQCSKICTHEHGENLSNSDLKVVCNKASSDLDSRFEKYDFTTNPEALVKGLTYAQAMAYYHWKYQRHAATNKSKAKIFEDLVPTEAQFEKIQNGESITIESQELTYPDPWFRYVVHFYAK